MSASQAEGRGFESHRPLQINSGHETIIKAMQDKGLIHIYTGDGKGKTSSALGLTVRARSRGKRIFFAQFFKERSMQGELSLLEQLGITTVVFDAIKSPFFHPDVDRNITRKETLSALKEISRAVATGDFDVIVLDEFLCLVSEGILTDEEAAGFLKNKPEASEIILTGRGATEKITSMADYVTFMKNVKHPYDKGIRARKGIEV